VTLLKCQAWDHCELCGRLCNVTDHQQRRFLKCVIRGNRQVLFSHVPSYTASRGEFLATWCPASSTDFLASGIRSTFTDVVTDGSCIACVTGFVASLGHGDRQQMRELNTV
jgi:hypothetical protein